MTGCPVCGSTARQPGRDGVVLHRFTKGERIVSSAGMPGEILAVPRSPREAGHVGYKVRWTNGSESRVRAASLDHDLEAV